ncbi:MAG: hypothetical protein A2Y53_07620 [Chloroflexi bacterium RBG_16_47_49]|nr:MAG: hypothetical protein A2Y53_07620 [Chloroflexi bacterium RBG_16_47_49]
MTLRSKLIEIVGGKPFGEERAKTQEAFNTMYEAYMDGPFRYPPQMLIERLSELDSSTILYLIRGMQSGITGLPYNASTEDQRQYQVTESRWQWLYSPLAQWSVQVWTSYGIGEKVAVTCNDEKAQEVWENVWDNSAIFDDDTIHMLSTSVLVDGDIYLAAFISIADGSVNFEYVNCDEIKEICTNPDNKNEPLYYKREYTATDGVTNHCIYYPDWHTYFYHEADLKKFVLPTDAVVSLSEAMDENKGTAVLMLHIAHNRKDANSLHGWPILGIAAPYFRAHKEFVENRLTISRQKASFVREFITGGGSRGVEAVRAKFGQQLSTSTGYSTVDANPPATAGSNLIHNQAVEHRDLPMTTGASDANTDNNMFSWMALIGAGLFPTTAGMDTSRWATALAMDKTQSAQWSRYQSFWACQFRKMVELVLWAAETWGNAKYPDKGSKVSIDTLSLVDFPGVVTPIASMLATLPNSGLSQNAQNAVIQALWTPVLTALGTEDIDKILSDDMLGVLEPEEAAQVAKVATDASKKLIEFALQVRRNKLAEKAGSNG